MEASGSFRCSLLNLPNLSEQEGATMCVWRLEDGKHTHTHSLRATPHTPPPNIFVPMFARSAADGAQSDCLTITVVKRAGSARFTAAASRQHCRGGYYGMEPRSVIQSQQTAVTGAHICQDRNTGEKQLCLSCRKPPHLPYLKQEQE